MKKTIVASVIALAAVAAGAANAATATGDKTAGTLDLNFVGTVSAVTCALEPSVDGVKSKNDIQLGQVKLGQGNKGEDIIVAFKPTPDSVTSCTHAGGDGFVMQWSGVGVAFDSNGLKATSGLADDAYVQIASVNSRTPDTMIASDNQQVVFDNDKVTSGDGLQYKVNLVSGTKVGDMTTTAQVKHWYK
ncbi:TPA: hypothetical protein J5F84_004894 [Escherichia coli]|nr:hypothetical protein [Escherichia coli]